MENDRKVTLGMVVDSNLVGVVREGCGGGVGLTTTVDAVC